MAFSRLNFSKLWTNPTDFPTVELDETQVRADMQVLHDEAKTALNKLMSALEAKTGAASLGAKAKDGSTKSTVQAELDALNALIVAAGNLPSGGSAGQYLKKNSDKNFDAGWVDTNLDTFAYKGVEIVGNAEDDTVAEWLKLGTCYSYYYNTETGLVGQPAKRGFVFSSAQGTYVAQRWVTLTTGEVYHRVGNTTSGWLTSWVQVATKDYVDSYALPKTGGEMTGSLTIRRNGVTGVNLFHANGKGGSIGQFANAIALTEYSDNTNTETSDYRRIRLMNIIDKNNVAEALMLLEKKSGKETPYTIFHTGSVESLLGASKIVTGVYTGNSTTPNNTLYQQTISLGFTPKLVVVFTEDGAAVSALPGADYVELSECTALKVVSGGFTAAYYYYDPANDNLNPARYGVNRSGVVYRYIAIG